MKDLRVRSTPFCKVRLFFISILMEEGINPNGRFTFYEYFKRALNYKQWDIETSLWQMINLCINPRKVYSNFKSHKRMISSPSLQSFIP